MSISSSDFIKKTISSIEIQRHDYGSIAKLTLNRPKSYNALSIDLMNSLLVELDNIDQSPDINVVIIEGAGKGFCAGHDLKEISANPTVEFRKKTFATCAKLMLKITNLRQPVIAKIHGIATAAGCQLVATCDLAIASDNARFGTPGANIGLFCSTPMVALSRAIHKKQALEMLLTGDMITAADAVIYGLVNNIVSLEKLDDAVFLLAEKISQKSSLVLKTGKAAFYKQVDMNLSDAYDYCADVMVENMAFKDSAEGIEAFIEKRRPKWINQ